VGLGRGDAGKSKDMADERKGDPRKGVESDEEYRQADPREIVDEGGVAMSGPGGAPQEDESVEERRARDRDARGSS
jgi:hypothetical protein